MCHCHRSRYRCSPTDITKSLPKSAQLREIYTRQRHTTHNKPFRHRQREILVRPTLCQRLQLPPMPCRQNKKRVRMRTNSQISRQNKRVHKKHRRILRHRTKSPANPHLVERKKRKDITIDSQPAIGYYWRHCKSK